MAPSGRGWRRRCVPRTRPRAGGSMRSPCAPGVSPGACTLQEQSWKVLCFLAVTDYSCQPIADSLCGDTPLWTAGPAAGWSSGARGGAGWPDGPSTTACTRGQSAACDSGWRNRERWSGIATNCWPTAIRTGLESRGRVSKAMNGRNGQGQRTGRGSREVRRRQLLTAAFNRAIGVELFLAGRNKERAGRAGMPPFPSLHAANAYRPVGR